MKLNIGGGPKRIEGYKNVDSLEWNGITDIVHDLTKYPWPFENNTVDHIICQEFLEHVSIHDSRKVLSELYRILIPEAVVNIQVPDAGLAMEYYVNGEICDCVPHKDHDFEKGFKPNPDCFSCAGKGKIHPNRWLYTFTGAQKHFPEDIHKNIFTKQRLEDDLNYAKFFELDWSESNKYKLIVKAKKIL